MNTILDKLAVGAIFCFGHNSPDGPTFEKLGDGYVRGLTAAYDVGRPRHMVVSVTEQVTFLRRTTRIWSEKKQGVANSCVMVFGQ